MLVGIQPTYDCEASGIDPGGYHDEHEVGAISLRCQRLPAMRASCVMTLSMCMGKSGALMSRTMPASGGEPGEGGRARHSSSRKLRAKKGRAPGDEFERFEPTWRRIQLMPGRSEGIKAPMWN